MPWQRESMPTAATFQGLKGYLSRSHENLDGTLANIERTLDLLLTIASVNGVLVNWAWIDGQDTSVDPGAGNIRGNNVQLSTVTQFALSRLDLYGRSVFNARFEVLDAGDVILVGDILRGAWHTFTLDGAAVLFETFGQLNLTPTGIGNTANPQSGDIMEVKWLPVLE